MREGIRASARLMPHLRHRHSRRGGARRPGYRHDLLHRQHPLRRRRRRGTLRLRLGPPRRRRYHSLPPRSRSTRRRGPHGYARRGRLGTPRGTRPDAPEHQTLSPNRRAGRPVRRLQGQNVVRDVAVVSFAQSTSFAPDPLRNEVELLLPVMNEAVERSGIPKKEIGFTVSGSCDYLAGAPFSFARALDAVGAWPPIIESPVAPPGASAPSHAPARPYPRPRPSPPRANATARRCLTAPPPLSSPQPISREGSASALPGSPESTIASIPIPLALAILPARRPPRSPPETPEPTKAQ